MKYKLKFLIIERYRTQSNFAKEIGRKDNWISRIITGRQTPTKEEGDLICTKLKIEDFKDYFGE